MPFRLLLVVVLLTPVAAAAQSTMDTTLYVGLTAFDLPDVPANTSADSTAVLLLVAASAQPLDIMEHLSPEPVRRHRNDALLNGALIAMGAVGILDNVIAHWILELHRAVPGEHALAVEIGIVIFSAAMLGVGLWREHNARRALPR